MGWQEPMGQHLLMLVSQQPHGNFQQRERVGVRLPRTACLPCARCTAPQTMSARL